MNPKHRTQGLFGWWMVDGGWWKKPSIHYPLSIIQLVFIGVYSWLNKVLLSLCVFVSLWLAVLCGFAVLPAEAAWRPEVGEKLTYTIRWMGIPVGVATLYVKEVVSINGRSTYHIVAQARSTGLISNIYRVRDEAHTYIDADGLFSWRFEKRQREDGYRADEIMEYDQLNHRAVYRSLLNNSTKHMQIPANVQDALSCLYYFRTLDSLEIGKPVVINVNADEKNWDLEIDILKKERIEMLKLGVWDTILVEPKPQFQGLFRKKGRMWISFSADERRLPLLVKVDVPKIGLVIVALQKIDPAPIVFQNDFVHQ